VQPGTDWFILSTGVANICLIGFANTAIGLDAQNVLTAVGDDLDAIRLGYGLPEVAPAPSSGKIRISVDGAVTIVDKTPFVLPNGLRGETSGANVNPADGAEINVVTVDTGEAANLDSGETVRFISPPFNLRTDATVSDGDPLTGGTDAESDEQKRQRILDTLQNKPAGGNWSFVRQVALDALGTVMDCYVFPALGGPGSTKAVPIKDFDIANNDFSRALSSTALQTVRAALQEALPGLQEMVVDTVTDEPVDATILVSLPASVLSGGNGSGWLDPSPWPPLVLADAGVVSISATGAGNDSLTLTALTTTAPIPGQTRVAWWSTEDRLFYTALVTSQSGASGAWVIGLDRALVSKDGSGPATGDYVSPAAQNIAQYGSKWVDLFRALGPSENTTDTDILAGGRALRHPFVASEDPSDITASTLSLWQTPFPEITNYSVGYISATTPTVPASIDDPPAILGPQRFAIYPR
jgi:hypothetical protein